MCLILNGISSPNRIYPTVPIPTQSEKLNRTMHMIGQAIRYLLIQKCLRDVFPGQILSIVKKYIPNMIKHIVSSFGIFVLYITAFLLITSFPIITNYTPRCNYIFGVCLLFTILSLITLLLTPETRGKSIAELENLFIGKSIFIFNYE